MFATNGKDDVSSTNHLSQAVFMVLPSFQCSIQWHFLGAWNAFAEILTDVRKKTLPFAKERILIANTSNARGLHWVTIAYRIEVVSA